MERFIQKKLLGSGGFARVFLVADKITKKEYAMKVMDISNMRSADYENEIDLFQNISHLSHPNIVKYETSFVNRYKRTCYIVMEYCDRKDFHKYRWRFEWDNTKPHEETCKNP